MTSNISKKQKNIIRDPFHTYLKQNTLKSINWGELIIPFLQSTLFTTVLLLHCFVLSVENF